VPYLERAVHLHAADPRAHLAAFTLGRVHLALGDASAAARAFADAQRLDGRGILQEQALAREVEAWSRAGREDLAQARARTYIQRFPEGRYADRVRRFGTSP
jgi:cytochrome c-type biogenesis protein CcmH/NrfG